MNDTYISVWYDETSGPDGPRWIVDRCDADDNSSTVRTFAGEDAARAFADRLSAKIGLPVR